MNPTRFRIDAAHPALPGHFPGRPLVPGVVLLDRVAAAVEHRLGKRIAALPRVKFLAPLLPGEEAELRIEEKDDKLYFSIFCDGVLLAGGVAAVDPACGGRG